LATNRLEVLRQMVERNPKDSFALYGLAMEYANREEYDQAMRAQDAVVVLVRPQRVYGLLR